MDPRKKTSNIYNKFDSVYILAEFEEGKMNGRYKIGFSTGATQNRIRSYKAGNSRLVKELYTVLVPEKQGKAIEGKIHREFYEQHIKNNGGGIEWFKLSMEQLQKVILFMFQFEARKDVLVPKFAFDLNEKPEAKIPFGRSQFSLDMVPIFAEDRPKPKPKPLIIDQFLEFREKGGLQERMKKAEIFRPIRYSHLKEI